MPRKLLKLALYWEKEYAKTLHRTMPGDLSLCRNYKTT